MANPIVLEANNDQVKTYLHRLLARLTDTAPLMAGVSQEMLRQVEYRFEVEGPGWPQLKPATVKRRGSAHPILQVIGALARSFTGDSGKDFAEAGTNDIRAPIHQFGGTIQIPARSQQAYFHQNKKTGEVGNRFVKKHKSNFAQRVTLPAYEITMPARPMIPVDANGNLTPTAAEAILGIFEDYVLE